MGENIACISLQPSTTNLSTVYICLCKDCSSSIGDPSDVALIKRIVESLASFLLTGMPPVLYIGDGRVWKVLTK
jgi:hypothetical protein